MTQINESEKEKKQKQMTHKKGENPICSVAGSWRVITVMTAARL